MIESLDKIAMVYITSEEKLQNPTAVTADMEMTFRGALAQLEDELFITGDGLHKPKGFRWISRTVSIEKKGEAVITIIAVPFDEQTN